MVSLRINILFALCLLLSIKNVEASENADNKPFPFNVSLIEVGEGYNLTSVNTAVFRGSSLVSNHDEQFIAYYDKEGYVTVGKRKIGSSVWNIKKLTYKGNIEDAHNIISIGIDGEGFLHLAFDHHGNALKYCRSIEPGSLDFGELEKMTYRDEDDVTYPEFYTLPNGDMIFAYRSGSSGRGNLILNRYDISKKKWERIRDLLIDGEDQRNAYWQMFIDKKGVIHISWVWRETWMVETNHDLCYAWSRDGGKNWEKSNGSLYNLPITLDSSEIIWEIPQNSELINQTGMTADKNGNPYIATYWRDTEAKVPQYRLVWNDGEKWESCQIGNRKEPFSLSGGGTKMIPISRPRIVCDGKKALYLFRDEERGSVVSVAYTPHIGVEKWEIFDLTDFSVDAWEPTIDQNLWNREGLLNVFVQSTHQGDGEKVAKTENNSSMIYILQIDFDEKK